MNKLAKSSPTVGIALGSGSARGWAHIGVLRALEDMGIRPTVVSGCSIGALVGSAYATGQLAQMERWASGLDWKDILAYLDISLLDGGFMRGEKLMQYAQKFIGGFQIESLPLRFAAVATDLESGREEWLREGDLLQAVRASMSLPGLFSPQKRAGRWLVDGGLVDPVPVSLCRALGADVVIAVNLNGDIVGKHLRRKQKAPLSSINPEVPQQGLWSKLSGQISSSLLEQKNALLSQLLGDSLQSPGLFDVMAGSINIMQDRITRSRMAGDPPDVLISPHLADLGLMEFDQAAVAIKEGRDSVERMSSALHELVI
jgi:NTE family protein